MVFSAYLQGTGFLVTGQLKLPAASARPASLGAPSPALNFCKKPRVWIASINRDPNISIYPPGLDRDYR